MPRIEYVNWQYLPKRGQVQFLGSLDAYPRQAAVSAHDVEEVQVLTWSNTCLSCFSIFNQASRLVNNTIVMQPEVIFEPQQQSRGHVCNTSRACEAECSTTSLAFGSLNQ